MMMMMSQWRADGGRVEPESLSQLPRNLPRSPTRRALSFTDENFVLGRLRGCPDVAAGRRAALCVWGCVVSFNACWTLRSSFCCRLSRPISREMPGMQAVKFIFPLSSPAGCLADEHSVFALSFSSVPCLPLGLVPELTRRMFFLSLSFSDYFCCCCCCQF